MKKTENDILGKKIVSLLDDYEPVYKHEYWENMQQKLDASDTAKNKSRFLPVFKYAAAILLLISISIYLFNSNSSKEIVKETNENEKSEIILNDGSLVKINRSTKLVYPQKFKNTAREVFLDGEAYFEVSENKEKPFVVNTSFSKVTVLGTKFNIKAYPSGNKDIVTVTEGKVMVVSKSSGNKIIVQKGETVSTDKSDNELNKTPIYDLNFDTWRTNKIQFVNDSLPHVVKILSHHYNKPVVLQSDNLKNLKLTCTITKLPLIEALEVVTTTLSLELEEKNDTIYLKKN
jgi:transmembrane sensor